MVKRIYTAIFLSFFCFFALGSSEVQAVDPSFHVGYYVGTGESGLTISGLDFEPDAVIIKSAGSKLPVLKTTAMASTDVAYLSFTADTTTTEITLTSDGFSLGTHADVNEAFMLYTYIAMGDSDCTGSGYLCVGGYTGNGTSPRAITSVGFQPDFVIVVRSTANNPTLRSSSQATNYGANFSTGAEVTDGSLFTTLNSDGFTIGSGNNSNGGTYYYLAFRDLDEYIATGTYTGNATDDRSITGVGFEPDFVLTKNVTNSVSTANRRVRAHFNSIRGDSTSSLSHAVINASDITQKMESDGFQIGANDITNGSGDTIYYLALGGTPAPVGSGTYTFNTGTYTGTGASLSITDVGFKPDLVIIKQVGTENAVFSTSVMASGNTANLGNTNADFTGGLDSFDSDGFTIESNSALNNNGSTYYWQAFGNAYSPHTHSGSTDFLIGAYYGNGLADRVLDLLPNSYDFAAIKRRDSSGGVWRTADMPAGESAVFTNGSFITSAITDFGTNSITLGNDSRINNADKLMWWFAFKEGDRFALGTYTGTGSTQSITNAPYQADLIWVKGYGNHYSLFKASNLTGDATQYFSGFTYTTGFITNLLSNGFSVGTANEVNENTTNYYYAGWNGKAYSQVGHRFFDDTSTADVGSALAAEDDPVTLTAPGERFRLRMLLHVARGYLYTSGADFKLQYAAKGVGTCASPTGSYADVTTGTPIAFDDSFAQSSGTALTSNASDPARSGVTVVEQSVHKSNSFTNDEALIESGQDGLWDFALIDNAAPEQTTYCLRVVASDDTTLDAYSLYPEVTTAQEIISVSITTDGTVAYGMLPANTTRTTLDLTDTQTAQNDGNVVVDLNIKTSNAVGGASWTLGASSGSDQFAHAFSINSGSSWTPFTTTDVYQVLTSALGVSSSQNFDLRIITPTTASDGAQKAITITIQAVQP